MVLKKIKPIDPMKYLISYVLDAIEIDIDPNTGRLYPTYTPDLDIVCNNKVMRMDFGSPPNDGKQYGIFNPIMREDHANILVVCIMQTQLEDNEKYANVDTDDFTFMRGVDIVDETMFVHRLMDPDGNLVGKGKGATHQRALFQMGCNFLLHLGVFNDNDIAEIDDTLELIDRQAEELANMSNAKRKIFLNGKKDPEEQRIKDIPADENWAAYHDDLNGKLHTMDIWYDIDDGEMKFIDDEDEVGDEEDCEVETNDGIWNSYDGVTFIDDENIVSAEDFKELIYIPGIDLTEEDDEEDDIINIEESVDFGIDDVFADNDDYMFNSANNINQDSDDDWYWTNRRM